MMQQLSMDLGVNEKLDKQREMAERTIPKLPPQLEEFCEVREYVEGMQTYFSEFHGDDDDRVRQTAYIWCMLNDCCEILYGRSLG